MIPSLQMRLNQYTFNKQVLSELMSLEKQSCDWIVTVAFYSALHLIEKNIISKKGNKKRKHTERNEIVINNAEFGNDVADAYQALFNESIAARYDCIPISKKRANDAIGYLNKIEETLK